jgi:Spy/CpxP family protein refolding chaperone
MKQIHRLIRFIDLYSNGEQIMHNPKILIMTIACVITFTVTPLAAAENIASHSTASGNLLLAQAHEQHADHNGKHDKKADDGHADHKEHGQHDKMQANYADMITSHAEALNLSDEQLGKIMRHHLKSSRENREIMQQAHKSMKALRNASVSSDANDDLLRKHAKDHADAITELAEKRISQRKAMHNILSEEQLKKLKTMKIHHGSHGSDNKGGHNHH